MVVQVIRTQVQLTEEQVRRIQQLAADRGVSMAQLIREAVDLYTCSNAALSREEQVRRAIAAAGRFRSGLQDLSVEHDKYLVEAFEE